MLLAFVLTLLSAPALADPVSSEAGQPSPRVPARGCVAGVASIHPVGSTPGSASDKWAISLATFADKPQHVSGVLALYAGNDRYDVQVQDVEARSIVRQRSVERPVVVRFPVALKIDGGYLASVEGAGAGSCPPEGGLTHVASSRPVKEAEVTNAPVVDAPAPVADPSATCATPFADSTTTKVAGLRVPEGATDNREGGTVTWLVLLDETGRVVGLHLLVSSDYSDLDRAAADSAQSTSYLPAVFRCVPIRSFYEFRADFQM
jgi:TonB family protein